MFCINFPYTMIYVAILEKKRIKLGAVADEAREVCYVSDAIPLVLYSGPNQIQF